MFVLDKQVGTEIPTMAQKILFFIIVAFVAITGVNAGCNRDSKATLLEKYDYRVSFGKEITWKDYATITVAAVADAFGCSSTCTTAVIDSILASLENTVKEQVKSIGMETLLQLISTRGYIETENARIDAGILTFQCTIEDNKCCVWPCKQRVLGVRVPCTGCSRSRCGYTSRPDINKQLPYIAITLKK